MLSTRSSLPVSTVSARSPLGPMTRDAGMPGGMAVAAAGRARGAGLADRPGGAEALLDLAGKEQRIRLGRGGDAGERGKLGVGDPQQFGARLPCIDDSAADEIGRGARDRQQCRRDHPGGRGFGDRYRFLRAPSASPRSVPPAATNPVTSCASVIGSEPTLPVRPAALQASARKEHRRWVTRRSSTPRTDRSAP